MSNTIAGDIFKRIMDEVVSVSQTDFEENGVSQQTLGEMQQVWQQKMTLRNIAQMPWDPKPAQPPVINASNASSQSVTPLSYQRPPSQINNDGVPRIKAEPGTEGMYNGGPAGGQPYMHQAMNPAIAQQRAASLLQQQFGSQANASLGAMQQRGIALPGQQKAPGHIQLPGQNQQQQMQQAYAQQLKQQQASQQPRIKTENDSPHVENGQFQQHQQHQQHQQQQQQQQRPNAAYAQTDGADEFEEWSKQLAAGRAVSAEQIANNDRVIRDHVAQLASNLEGGLMVSLDHKKRSSKRTKHARRAAPSHSGPYNESRIPQLDGDLSDDEKTGIKDEDDEDAINSDLDSSGEEDAKADEDDDDIDSMLCTYDKVQRVKNKWKCTLKDGVLLANGKEYLFHKAQGEFEW